MGLFGLISNTNWRRQRLLVLCYHGISLADEHEWDPELYMPQRLFRERMEAIRRARCHVLPLGEAVRRLQRGILPERSVAITFDDGLTDFHRRALPVLREFGYPATLYLTTYYSEHQFPVFPPICSYVLWQRRGRIVGELDLRTRESRAAALQKLCQKAEADHLSSHQKDEMVAQLAEQIGADYQAIRQQRLLHLMNGEELRSIAESGVDIQLHTHCHRVPLEPQAFRWEMEENSKRIEQLTGQRPTHFCYPGGVHRPEFLPWLKELGIESATTCHPGLAAANDSTLLLPRFVDTSLTSPDEFESWLHGLSAWLPRRNQ